MPWYCVEMWLFDVLRVAPHAAIVHSCTNDNMYSYTLVTLCVQHTDWHYVPLFFSPPCLAFPSADVSSSLSYLPALLAKSKGTAFSQSLAFHLYEKRHLLCECFGEPRGVFAVFLCVALFPLSFNVCAASNVFILIGLACVSSWRCHSQALGLSG